MLGDVEPNLEYVTNRYTVVQNHGAKHGFGVPWNTHIDVRIGAHAACRACQHTSRLTQLAVNAMALNILLLRLIRSTVDSMIRDSYVPKHDDIQGYLKKVQEECQNA
jgi:hypothetical protein